jgi:hypothetical protein
MDARQTKNSDETTASASPTGTPSEGNATETLDQGEKKKGVKKGVRFWLLVCPDESLS